MAYKHCQWMARHLRSTSNRSMNYENFEIALIAAFFTKLLWNIFSPSAAECKYQKQRKIGVENPHSFNLFLGLEVVILIIFSLIKGFERNSFSSGFVILLFYSLVIAASYFLAAIFARVIRKIL
jgi:hypothetical protein